MSTTPGQAPTERPRRTRLGYAGPGDAGSLVPAEQALALPGAPVVKKTERPHPLTPLIRGWLVFLAFIVYFVRDLVPDGSDDGLDFADLRWILPIVAAVVVIAGVAGFFTWYFTRFVIDDDELRIETGWVFKKSKKIPFERLQSVDIIQPLAARLFGLAELRLEAGAGDSTTKLRYLTRRQSSRLRDYLLTRAHGEQARISDLEGQAPANILTDLGATDRPLVTVPPQRLIFGLVLSSEWIISVLFLVAAVVTTVVFEVVQFAFSALIPLAIGAVDHDQPPGHLDVQLHPGRVAAGPADHPGADQPDQPVGADQPAAGGQGQPAAAVEAGRLVSGGRRRGRLRPSGDGEDNESQATNVLLPVATRAEVDLALSRALPGFDLDGIELHPVPRRARWLRWFDWWTLRYGWDDRALITEHGWMIHSRDIVPHAKTQSVRIEQGPWQRRLRLADVHIDTPKGPVNLVAHQLDAHVARELTLTQLDRARAARAADRQRRPVDQVVDDHAGEAALLADVRHQSGAAARFRRRERGVRPRRGAGAPALPEPARGARADHRQLRALYGSWAAHRHRDRGAADPRTAAYATGGAYTIDRRFSGRSFSGWLATAEPDRAASRPAQLPRCGQRLRQLPSPVPGFARLVGRGCAGAVRFARRAGPQHARPADRSPAGRS